MIRGAEICPRITITKITISEKEMHLQKEQECGEMSRKTKKCGYRKRILAGVLSAVVALSSVQMPVTAVHAAAWDQNKFSDSLKLRFWNNEKPGVRFYINAAAKYILENQQEQSEKTGNSYPTVGSTFGEWSVWDLLRGMYTGADYINSIPENYFSDYLKRVEAHVENKKGNLHAAKSTEWSRLILPLTAMGYDIRSVAGYDFIEKLSDSFSFSYRQGINGPIWEIISMNSGGYEFDQTDHPETANTFGKMLDYILNLEITDANGIKGGWALSGNVPDADITGMTLTAFAPYYLSQEKYEQTDATYSYDEFASAVERGILVLANMQKPNGGFESWGTVNSESTVWAMMPLLEMGIDPKSDKVTLPHIGKTCSFVKEGATRDGVYTDNMVDALLTFWAAGSGSSASIGGFKHVTAGYDGGGGSGTTVNPMATDQALYGLIAYDRFAHKQNSLFDMQDQLDGSYLNATADTYTITYDGQKEGETFTTEASPYAEVLLSEGKVTDEQEAFLTEWNTKPDGSGISYYPGELLSMPEQDITLYAQYGQPSYALKFELNGGTLSDDIILPDTYSPKDQITLPTADEITKAGCKFDGWYTNAEFTGRKVTEIPAHSYGDKTFYAKWTVNTEKANQFYAIVNRLSGHATAISDKEDIEKARELYDSMLDIERERITASTYHTFLKKEKELKELLASMDQAEQVSAMIKALDKELTLADEQPVVRARNAYDALTETEKAMVENLDILTKAEEKISQMKENKEKADAVIRQIEAIGDVTLDSREEITAAREAFQALTESQQALVPERVRKLLENAEKKITELLEKKDRIDAFSSCVKRIPEKVSLTDDSLSLLMNAHAAWLKLNDEERAQVDGKLIEQIKEKEKELQELAQAEATDEDYTAVKEMEERIAAASGEVKLEDEETLKKIRSDFDAMTKIRQAMVVNYYSLVAQEMDLEKLKKDTAIAEAISERITALGEITFESEETLTALRKDYTALTTAQKNLVRNYELLAQAENKLADLKYNRSQAESAVEKINAIGEVTLNSREAIAKARAAYDALLEDQKQYVSEEILKILTDAEAEYARLESLVLKNITLDKTEVNMKKGERVTLHVTYDPEDTISDKTIIWNVADPSVATVENGTVTAIGGGETAVSAHVGMLTATCTLKVEVPLEKLTFTENSVTLKKGESHMLKVQLLPEDLNVASSIRYRSANPQVASVDADGQVRALASGETLITAYCVEQPQILAQIKVTVKETQQVQPKPTDPNQNITVSVPKVSFISLKASRSKKAVLKWKKIKGVSGYEISYAIGKKKNWKRAKTIKKANTTKLTWKKLKSRKKYYFKIQAYKIVRGKKYSGKYSKIRSVKVK